MNIVLEDIIKLSVYTVRVVPLIINVHVDKGHMFIFSYCDSY